MAFSKLRSTLNALRPNWVCALALLLIGLVSSHCTATEPEVEGVSSREARMQAIAAVPLKKMNQSTVQALRDVLDNPSFYRRMPTQTIACDAELFKFLVRKPEVMVNTWDLMGITKVTAKRTGPFSFFANDGVGTKCKCDLVYGSDSIHIYYGSGDYDGSMTARSIKGRAVCILRSENQQGTSGQNGNIVRGTMDVFLKLDNLGADLLTRTFGPLVAKTADHNFAETAQFVAQLSQICANNPPAALGLATQLNNIDESVRQEFATIATRIADESRVAQLSVPPTVDRALVSKTLDELKVASAHSAPQQATGMSNPKLTSAAAPQVQATSVPPMQFGGPTSSDSTRKQFPFAAESPAPQSPVNIGDLPASPVLPKKTGVTMRR